MASDQQQDRDRPTATLFLSICDLELNLTGVNKREMRQPEGILKTESCNREPTNDCVSFGASRDAEYNYTVLLQVAVTVQMILDDKSLYHRRHS